MFFYVFPNLWEPPHSISGCWSFHLLSHAIPRWSSESFNGGGLPWLRGADEEAAWRFIDQGGPAGFTPERDSFVHGVEASGGCEGGEADPVEGWDCWGWVRTQKSLGENWMKLEHQELPRPSRPEGVLVRVQRFTSDVAQVLLDAKADVNAVAEYDDKTPLHQAAQHGFAETVMRIKHKDQDFLTTGSWRDKFGARKMVFIPWIWVTFFLLARFKSNRNYLALVESQLNLLAFSMFVPQLRWSCCWLRGQSSTRRTETAGLRCSAPPVMVTQMSWSFCWTLGRRWGWIKVEIKKQKVAEQLGRLQHASNFYDMTSPSSTHTIQVNVVNMHDQTPLHVATWSGKADAVKLLLEHHASVNVVDDSGSTPLITAAQRTPKWWSCCWMPRQVGNIFWVIIFWDLFGLDIDTIYNIIYI